MPRLYHGEPSAEDFGAAVGELVLNETPGPFLPLAKYAEAMKD